MKKAVGKKSEKGPGSGERPEGNSWKKAGVRGRRGQLHVCGIRESGLVLFFRGISQQEGIH